MFSAPAIVELSKDFVIVKADTRSPDFDPDSRRHKATRYVPEIVLLSPDEEVLGRLRSNTTVESTRSLMESVLKKVRR